MMPRRHRQLKAIEARKSSVVQSSLAKNKVPEGPREAAALAVLNGVKVEATENGVIVDTDMGPKTLDDYVSGWVAKEGSWAVPAPSGGGSTGSGQGGGSNAPKSWAEAKTTADKVAHIKSKRE